MFFVCGEGYLFLASRNGFQVEAQPEDQFSSQELADTRIILHCQHVAQHHPTTIIVDRFSETVPSFF